MVLSSEENDGCNDVRVVQNELAIEVCIPKERMDSLNRGRGLPVLNSRKLSRIHANEALSNDHP